jgi:hypothetical protein
LLILLTQLKVRAGAGETGNHIDFRYGADLSVFEISSSAGAIPEGRRVL